MASEKRGTGLSEVIMRDYYKKYSYIYKNPRARQPANADTERFKRIRFMFMVFNLAASLAAIAIIAMVFL